MTNGPVNAHLISGHYYKHKTYKTWIKMAEQTSALITDNSLFTYSVYYINQTPGHRMQLFPKNPSLSHFPI